MIKSGKYRGDSLKYPYCVGCCIWQPIDGDENIGRRFDFDHEDIGDIILLLQGLQVLKPREDK